jgi:ribonuclease HI
MVALKENPYPSGLGGVLCNVEVQIYWIYMDYIGNTTNNIIELQALEKGLRIVFLEGF